MSHYSIVRATTGRILTNTNDLQLAYSFSKRYARMHAAPLIVRNNQTGQKVLIGNSGNMISTRDHTVRIVRNNMNGVMRYV